MRSQSKEQKKIKNQASLSKPYKPELNSQTCNPLNSQPGLNPKAQQLKN